MDNEKKKQLIEQIVAFPKLCENVTLDEAIKWSNNNPETKPHFIVHQSKDHVIIY